MPAYLVDHLGGAYGRVASAAPVKVPDVASLPFTFHEPDARVLGEVFRGEPDRFSAQ